MTTTATPRVPHGHYRFAHVARMEWAKLRSLRSTWWVLAVTVAGAIGIAVAVGVNTEDAAADLTNNALAGISLGLLLVGVLGVLAMTGEYTTGTIRATLAAGPTPPAGPGGQVGLVRRGRPGRGGGGGVHRLRRRRGRPAAGRARAHPRPAGRAPGGGAGGGRLLPDRAARCRARRRRPPHPGRHRRARRRRLR